MTYFRLGVGLTVCWLVLWLFVVDARVDDWWGGPAVFGMVVLLYWALGRQFFGPGDADPLLLPGDAPADQAGPGAVADAEADADVKDEPGAAGGSPATSASTGKGSSESHSGVAADSPAADSSASDSSASDSSAGSSATAAPGAPSSSE